MLNNDFPFFLPLLKVSLLNRFFMYFTEDCHKVKIRAGM